MALIEAELKLNGKAEAAVLPIRIIHASAALTGSAVSGTGKPASKPKNAS